MKRAAISLIVVFLSAVMLSSVSGCSRPAPQTEGGPQDEVRPQTGTGLQEADGEENMEPGSGGQTLSVSGPANLEELRSWYGEPVKLSPGDVPETCREEVFGNISINAEVRVPENLSFGKIKVNGKKFEDHEKIIRLFITDAKTEESESDTLRWCRAYGSDGSELQINHQEGLPDDFLYLGGGDIYNRRIDDMKLSYMEFVRGSNTFFSSQARKFFDKTEIPGLSADDAVHTVAKKAEELGIECSPQPQVFVIDSEGVDRYREDFRESFPGATENDVKFTSGDDAYLIFFNLACGGMPICEDGWYNYDEMVGYTGEYLYGVVGRNGLLEFYANPGYTVEEELDADLKLYNTDIVGKVLKKQFDLGLETPRCEFISMSLEYCCTSGENEELEGLVFEPCWACKYNSVTKINSKENISTNILFINASTGELMNTSGSDRELFIDRGQ